MFLKNSQNQYKSDWLKCIKNILDRCGYSNVWISQGNVNPKWLSVSLKQKLFDQFQFFKNMYIYKMFAILLSFPFTIFDQQLIMRSSI
jgi:beta-lactamase class D